MPETSSGQTLEILNGISTTGKIIAFGYLDFIIYFFFFFSSVVFLLFAITSIPPFNKPIVRFYTLFLIATVGLMLFFKEYLYILLLFVSVIIFLTISVREEIRQIILVINYKRKELKVDLGEYEKLTASVERADDIYSRFSFIKTFQTFKLYGKNSGNKLKGFNEKVFPSLLYLNFFSLLLLAMNLYAIFLIYETGYFLFTD